MSNHSKTGNPSGEKTAASGNSGPQHRKRQSPNNPATIVSGSSSTAAARDPSSASSSKLRKVSTATGSSNNDKGNDVPSKQNSKQVGDDGTVGTSTGTKRNPRELSALIQPFPDRAAISEERLTRSKAKALVLLKKYKNFPFFDTYFRIFQNFIAEGNC
jgi:hypothetical protein